jgi:hypothetical protein
MTFDGTRFSPDEDTSFEAGAMGVHSDLRPLENSSHLLESFYFW